MQFNCLSRHCIADATKWKVKRLPGNKGHLYLTISPSKSLHCIRCTMAVASKKERNHEEFLRWQAYTMQARKRSRDKLCHMCPDIMERGNKTRGVLLKNQLGKVVGMVLGLHRIYVSRSSSTTSPCHDGSSIKRDHHGESSWSRLS